MPEKNGRSLNDLAIDPDDRGRACESTGSNDKFDTGHNRVFFIHIR